MQIDSIACRMPINCRIAFRGGLMVRILLRVACGAVALSLLAAPAARASQSAWDLVEQFQRASVFWKQFQVAQQIVALKDPSVLPKLSEYLTDPDRHTRANAAFVFAALGEKRGLDVLLKILNDRSYRPMGQGQVLFSCLVPRGGAGGCPYDPKLQVQSDRYYAAHVLGDLKDPRAVAGLVSVLNVSSVNLAAIWSLAQIDDKRAIAPLIGLLAKDDPTVQVSTIRALERMDAKAAIPALCQLIKDEKKSRVDDMSTVGAAARQALIQLAAPWSWFACPES